MGVNALENFYTYLYVNTNLKIVRFGSNNWHTRWAYNDGVICNHTIGDVFYFLFAYIHNYALSIQFSFGFFCFFFFLTSVFNNLKASHDFNHLMKVWLSNHTFFKTCFLHHISLVPIFWVKTDTFWNRGWFECCEPLNWLNISKSWEEKFLNSSRLQGFS